MRELLALSAAFLIGSIPSAFIWVKIKTGNDIRALGSGNVGATNVFRSVGKMDGLFVLTVDALKGIIGVFLGAALWSPGDSSNVKFIHFVLGCAAILGHVFTPWLKFRGGKGVATGAGVALAVYPLPFAAALGVWCILLKFSGYMSVASILSAYVFALATALWVPNKLHAALAFAAAIFITWTHRANLSRLRGGKEPKFSFQK